MPAAYPQIVLAISDLTLRTLLVAELGMAGEVLITTSDHRDPGVSWSIREEALLIIEASLIEAGRADWAAELKRHNWSGKVIAVMNDDETPPHPHDDIYVVLRRNAVAETLELLIKWRMT